MKKYFILFFIFICFQTQSHEIKPAVVDVIISDGSVSIELVINAETILAEVDASTYQDTNNAPESLIYDDFRALSDERLIEFINDQSIQFINKIKITDLSGPLKLQLEDIFIFPEGNLEIPRETTLKFIGETNNENDFG